MPLSPAWLVHCSSPGRRQQSRGLRLESLSGSVGDWRPETETWFADGRNNGIAIIGGAGKSKSTILDFEIAAAYEHWLERVFGIGSHLLDGVLIARTPSGGYHVYLRCRESVPGNAKLAIAKKPVRGKARVLIETRGEGGYVVAPGSPASCHATGKTYEWLDRGWIDGEHDALHPDAVAAPRHGPHFR